MAFLVLLVLHDPDHCHPLLDAWEAAGAQGITVIESSGLGRLRQAMLQDNVPLLPSLRDLLRSNERQNRTLFSVVQTQAQVDALVQAAQQIVGDFDQPDTGLLIVAELSQVFGLAKRRGARAREVGEAG